MANTERKMATVRKVDSVTPIEGADRIECVHVGGWVVVDRKGIWKEGDYCVYVEIDAFLPTDDRRYQFLKDRGVRTMTIDGVEVSGHVLRTAKMRGQYSQGIVFKPEDVLPDTSSVEEMYLSGERLDDLLGIREYEPDKSLLAAGFVGKYDSYVAPRTGCERAQNVDADTFDLLKRSDCYTSVKMDGTSTTIVFDPRTDSFEAYSHNNHYSLEDGLGLTVKQVADRQGLTKWCEEHPGMSLGCELCGPKFQSNRLGLKGLQLFVFSMWDMVGQRYLNPYDDESLRQHCAPLVDGFDLSDFAGPDDLILWVDGIKSHVVSGRLDEGIVVHAIGKGDLSDVEWESLKSALGRTVQIKAVSNRYLMKAK